MKYLDELVEYTYFEKVEDGLYYVSLDDSESKEPQSAKGMLKVLHLLEHYKPLLHLQKQGKLEMVVDDRALVVKCK